MSFSFAASNVLCLCVGSNGGAAACDARGRGAGFAGGSAASTSAVAPSAASTSAAASSIADDADRLPFAAAAFDVASFFCQPLIFEGDLNHVLNLK